MARHLLASLLLVGCTAPPPVQAPAPPPTPQSALRDFDGDGVMDPQDRCPREPGNALLGCPEPDGDGDGVVDSKDACPRQGGSSANGCPDADKDSIADTNDACPDKAEIFNGYADGDGCPDDLPKDLAKATGIIKGVTFEIDKDALQRSALPVLDRAVKILKKYPEVRIEISGHSDSTGLPAYGRDLPKQRADAVKRYLVESGIDEARLETRSAGADEPIDTNKTAAGRARNRRIEFTILVQ